MAAKTSGEKLPNNSPEFQEATNEKNPTEVVMNANEPMENHSVTGLKPERTGAKRLSSLSNSTPNNIVKGFSQELPVTDGEKLLMEAELNVEGKFRTMVYRKCTEPLILRNKPARAHFEADSFKVLHENPLPKSREALEMRTETLLLTLTGTNDSRPWVYRRYSKEEILSYLKAIFQIGWRIAKEYHLFIAFEQHLPGKVISKLTGSDIVHIPSIDLWLNNPDVKIAMDIITESIPNSEFCPLNSFSNESRSWWEFAKIKSSELKLQEELEQEKNYAVQWLSNPIHKHGTTIYETDYLKNAKEAPIPKDPTALAQRVNTLLTLIGGPAASEVVYNTAEDSKKYIEYLLNLISFILWVRKAGRFVDIKFSRCHEAIDKSVSRGDQFFLMPGPSIYSEIEQSRWISFFENASDYTFNQLLQKTCACCSFSKQ